MNEQEIDYLDIRIPIAKGYKPTTAEVTALVAQAVEKALVTR